MSVKLSKLAVDIDLNREATFLVGAGRDNNGTIRVGLIDTWPGGDTATDVAAAVKRYGQSEVCLDPATAGTLSEALRRAGVQAAELDARGGPRG